MQRRAGQPILDLAGSVPDLRHQALVLGLDPDRDQGDRPGEHDDRAEQGAPRGRQHRQARAVQARGDRLQQRGQQQRGRARDHHHRQPARHAVGQVKRDADEQQPPGPASGDLEPVRHDRPGRPRGGGRGLIRRIRASRAVDRAIDRAIDWAIDRAGDLGGRARSLHSGMRALLRAAALFGVPDALAGGRQQPPGPKADSPSGLPRHKAI